MNTFASIWPRIEKWYRVKVDPTFILPKGASEDDFDYFRSELGFEMPLMFRESYIVCNGSGGASILSYGSTVLSVGDMSAAYGRLQENFEWMPEWARTIEPEEGLQPVRWHPGILRFAASPCGDYLCLDLNPGVGGQIGQVVDYYHEVGCNSVLSPNFLSYLSSYANDLEAGKMVYNGENERIEASTP